MVFRDIIIKTILQLKPLMREKGFDISKIFYRPEYIHKIPRLLVDRARLNQVVFNVLMNAIKYAEDDPNRFAIRIEVDENRNFYIIKFKDWGIGVKKGLEDKIFEAGFRAPEAIDKYVTGSGLGLKISRDIMRGLGGDLKLTSSYKPTEFGMMLPKTLRENKI